MDHKRLIFDDRKREILTRACNRALVTKKGPLKGRDPHVTPLSNQGYLGYNVLLTSAAVHRAVSHSVRLVRVPNSRDTHSVIMKKGPIKAALQGCPQQRAAPVTSSIAPLRRSHSLVQAYGCTAAVHGSATETALNTM